MGGTTGLFTGTYTTSFKFKVVDNYGNKSSDITCTLNITDLHCATISSVTLETINI